MRVPKKIHYCWFGKKNIPDNFDLCLRSWKKYLTEFQIIKWDESNFEFDNYFLQQAKKDEMWAFISDYARLKILYDHGGIYLDVDMLLLRPLTEIFKKYDLILGSESIDYINAGLMISVPRVEFLKHCINCYSSLQITGNNYGELTIPKIITKCFREKYNCQLKFDQKLDFENLVIYPSSYFYNYGYEDKIAGKDFHDFIDKNTYALHLWNASWVKSSNKKLAIAKKGFLNIILDRCKKWIFP